MLLINKITIPLNPVPASRPRVTRWGVYYGKKHTQFIRDVEQLFLDGIIKSPQKPREGLFHVEVLYRVKIPKSTSIKAKNELNNSYCDKNIDLDNLNKLIYDEVLVNNFIEDDRYIVSETSSKVWTSDEGSIEIRIYSI